MECCFQSVKDTNLKANHNSNLLRALIWMVVFSRSKIRIWKQITTQMNNEFNERELFSVGQRYEFESKSQPFRLRSVEPSCCFQSVKDTNLKANHNTVVKWEKMSCVVFSRSKIRIWKQITTPFLDPDLRHLLFSVGQRYEFESKSQQVMIEGPAVVSCFQSVKDTNLKANHNPPWRFCCGSLGVFRDRIKKGCQNESSFWHPFFLQEIRGDYFV